jgi:hypothetical protein
MYSPNRITGQWRAHGRYITRESVTQRQEARVFGDQGEVVAPPEVLDRWQKAGDPRLWKMIISPEFGERIDLKQLTGDLMRKLEKDLDTRLEWVAIPHCNTEHPHVHVALRGIKADGSPLHLKREYIRYGIRSIAEDLCTGQIGHRNQVDAMMAERREIQEPRYTSLDRTIKQGNAAGQVNGSDDAGHFIVRRNVNGAARCEFARIREQHIAARLIVLQKMGLAELGSDPQSAESSAEEIRCRQHERLSCWQIWHEHKPQSGRRKRNSALWSNRLDTNIVVVRSIRYLPQPQRIKEQSECKTRSVRS